MDIKGNFDDHTLGTKTIIIPLGESKSEYDSSLLNDYVVGFKLNGIDWDSVSQYVGISSLGVSDSDVIQKNSLSKTAENMRLAMLAKFTQNLGLKRILLRTGNSMIYEQRPGLPGGMINTPAYALMVTRKCLETIFAEDDIYFDGEVRLPKYERISSEEELEEEELKEEEIINCERLYSLRWTQNSCYLDSLMMALFAVPNKFISRNILDRKLTAYVGVGVPDCADDPIKDLEIRELVQDEIVKIADSIQGRRRDKVKKCTDLRWIMLDCKSGRRFAGGAQEESGAFMQFLESVVGGLDFATRDQINYGTNDTVVRNWKNIPKVALEKTSEQRGYSSVIVHVLSESIDKQTRISNLLHIVDDTTFSTSNPFQPWKDEGNPTSFKRLIRITEYIDSPYLIFFIERGYITREGKREFRKSTIIPDKKIRFKNGKKLNLSAIIVKSGRVSWGHYTCFYVCNNVWYYYNDLKRKRRIVKVGSYKKMLKYREGDALPLTQSTLVFYT